MKDSYGRKINYARISVTDLCNLRCKYCMPSEGVKKETHNKILRLEQIERIVGVLVSLGVDKVRLTGGEPLVRRGILQLVEHLSEMPGIKDFSMTTNGILLGKLAGDLKTAGLKRLNISLDTLDPDKFRQITACGDLSDVFKGIAAAKSAGFERIKLNTTLIKGFNDDEIKNLAELTVSEDIDVRFIELMAIGTQANWTLNRFLPGDYVLEVCGKLEPVEQQDPASPAKYYRIPGAKGRIGIIGAITHKFCGNCNRIRITADGKLKSCLHSDREVDLKAAIDDEEALKKIITDAIMEKIPSHELERGKYIDRDMSRIGG